MTESAKSTRTGYIPRVASIRRMVLRDRVRRERERRKEERKKESERERMRERERKEKERMAAGEGSIWRGCPGCDLERAMREKKGGEGRWMDGGMMYGEGVWCMVQKGRRAKRRDRREEKEESRGERVDEETDQKDGSGKEERMMMCCSLYNPMV